jgi:hypothetical protein
MSKESAASYDMAEFDQSAIFLYLEDGHDQEQQRRMLWKKFSLLSLFVSRTPEMLYTLKS